jgi:phage FluMu protein gp41
MTGGLALQTLHAMNTQSAPSTAESSVIDDIYSLTLADGLPVESGGKTLRYKKVRMRETNVADERAAARMAERVMVIGGVPKLLVSEAEFRYALTMLHVESFECDGVVLHRALLNLDIFSKLSTHDLQQIEERVVLVTLAAQVRYGTLTQKEFEDFVLGRHTTGVKTSPQPVGQTASVGESAGDAESGPTLLTDYLGADANGAAGGIHDGTGKE